MKRILGSLALALVAVSASAGSMSAYLANKLLDATMRGQAYTFPATVYVGLATSSGSVTACGTEVTGTGYARVAVTSSLANWSGTQGSGTTVASSGTTAPFTISNNATITFGVPLSTWGTVYEMCVFDAATSGNLLWRQTLASPQTINSGGFAPYFSAGTLSWSLN